MILVINGLARNASTDAMMWPETRSRPVSPLRSLATSAIAAPNSRVMRSRRTASTPGSAGRRSCGYAGAARHVVSVVRRIPKSRTEARSRRGWPVVASVTPRKLDHFSPAARGRLDAPGRGRRRPGRCACAGPGRRRRPARPRARPRRRLDGQDVAAGRSGWSSSGRRRRARGRRRERAVAVDEAPGRDDGAQRVARAAPTSGRRAVRRAGSVGQAGVGDRGVDRVCAIRR